MLIPTCQQMTDFLDDYIEGRLSVARRATFEIHLLGCRDCRRFLKSYRQTLTLARHEGRPGERPEPPPLPEDLIKAITASMGDGPQS